MKTKKSLEKEFKYYLNNKDMFIKKYLNRFLIIKDEKIQGDYGTEIEAIEEGKKRFELGTFLVQHCTQGENSYTQTFHNYNFKQALTASQKRGSRASGILFQSR